MKTQIIVRTENTKITRNFGTGNRMLRYKRISNFFFMDTFGATKNLENNCEVTHDANNLLLIRVSFMLGI